MVRRVTVKRIASTGRTVRLVGLRSHFSLVRYAFRRGVGQRTHRDRLRIKYHRPFADNTESKPRPLFEATYVDVLFKSIAQLLALDEADARLLQGLFDYVADSSTEKRNEIFSHLGLNHHSMFHGEHLLSCKKRLLPTRDKIAGRVLSEICQTQREEVIRKVWRRIHGLFGTTVTFLKSGFRLDCRLERLS